MPRAELPEGIQRYRTPGPYEALARSRAEHHTPPWGPWSDLDEGTKARYRSEAQTDLDKDVLPAIRKQERKRWEEEVRERLAELRERWLADPETPAQYKQGKLDALTHALAALFPDTEEDSDER
jgi:hypothetical protein